MIRVNHINIVKIRRCGFISEIYGVIQREVPYREGLELSVACGNSPLMLVVKL